MGLPRPWDQQWSLRLQQILALETDLLEFEDIFDGSHVIDRKTEALKNGARDELAKLDKMGGAVESVAYMKERLVEAHSDRIKGIEKGSQIVVGVNEYLTSESSPLGTGDEAIMTVDPMVESTQVSDLKAWRKRRDSEAASRALAELKSAAEEGRNIM